MRPVERWEREKRRRRKRMEEGGECNEGKKVREELSVHLDTCKILTV